MLKTLRTSLVRNKEMLKYFPTPPMVAYRQPKNLKNTLIRTKLPQLKRNQRHLVGNKKCNKPPCKMCPYVLETKNIKSKTNQSFETTNLFHCKTTGVIYVITCGKCAKQYVGQTGKRCVDRFGQHINYVNRFTEATGKHFNLPGHSHKDLQVQVIEKVCPNTESIRLQREDLWIRRLNTMEPNGLNKKE